MIWDFTGIIPWYGIIVGYPMIPVADKISMEHGSMASMEHGSMAHGKHGAWEYGKYRAWEHGSIAHGKHGAWSTASIEHRNMILVIILAINLTLAIYGQYQCLARNRSHG